MASHTVTVALDGAFVVTQRLFPSVMTKLAEESFRGLDVYHGGTGRITGTVKEAHTPTDTPVVRRVRLHRKRDGLLIREAWSAADGSYTFDNILDTQQYYVVAFDHTDNYNAVIKDSLTPEPMP